MMPFHLATPILRSSRVFAVSQWEELGVLNARLFLISLLFFSVASGIVSFFRQLFILPPRSLLRKPHTDTE